MKAAILHQVPGKMEIDDVAVDKPAADEVLVRVVASGLCHSDLHVLDATLSYYQGGVVLGHEAAGVVEAVGERVGYVQPGDHVVACTSAFCGVCEYCLTGRPALCRAGVGSRPQDQPPRLTYDGKPLVQFANLGGFAEQMLVSERAVVKIDPEFPLDQACLIGCGVTTGVGAVLNTAKVQPGSTVAVVGCGGVGLSAVQGASVAGARKIIAVDTQASKGDIAKRMGATHFVDASGGDAVATVRELSGGGVDYSFEAIGLKLTIEQCFEMLRAGGTATIIGIAAGGDKIELVPMQFFQEKRLQGSAMGSNRFRIDIPRYIELAQIGKLKLDEMIAERIRLEEVNEGYEAMRRQEILGRKVIVFDS